MVEVRVPTVAQGEGVSAAAGTLVPSPAQHSGIRIWHCCSHCNTISLIIALAQIVSLA